MFAIRIVMVFLATLLMHAAQADSGYKPTGVVPKSETYVFAVHPYSNPQDLFAAYEPIMRYLEQKIPGVKFRLEASKDYPDYEAKIAARSFQFGLPNPFQAVFSLDHGYRVIAKMTPDEDFRGLIIARADRKVANPNELAGKKLCFPSSTAVAGTMLPLLYLHDHGLNVNKDIQISYVGSQYSSILNVLTGDFAACGSTARFWRVWSRENPDKAKDIVVLWHTDSLPHNAVIVRNDVSADLAQKVAAALAGMDKDKGLDQTQFKADQSHFELASDANYKPMADFLKHYDQSIGLPPQMRLQRK